jgi:hypothetical protein
MRQMLRIAESLVAVALIAAPAAAQVIPPPPASLIAPLMLRSTAPPGTDCLQPINASKLQGAAIVRATCKAAPEQLWIMIEVGNGNLHLMNALSGLCLDARGSATSGTPVQQWTCNEISNENWELNGPAFIVSFTSKVSGTKKYCLDVNDNGPWAQIYGCNGTPSQLWKINAPPFVVVPNVTGLDAGAASDKVYEYGLVPHEQPPDSPTDALCTSKTQNVVVVQSPNAGQVEEAKDLKGNKTWMGLIVCPLLQQTQSGSVRQ